MSIDGMSIEDGGPVSGQAEVRKRRKSGFWMGDQYSLDHSIVACIEEDSFARGFWSYGCDLDWQDAKLGLFPTRRKAEIAAEKWVKERI